MSNEKVYGLNDLIGITSVDYVRRVILNAFHEYDIENARQGTKDQNDRSMTVTWIASEDTTTEDLRSTVQSINGNIISTLRETAASKFFPEMNLEDVKNKHLNISMISTSSINERSKRATVEYFL